MRRIQGTRRRRRGSAIASVAKVPWPASITIAVAVACFFWLLAADVHLPGAGTNQFVWALDHAVHRPALLWWAGWVVLAFGLFASVLSWYQGLALARLLERQRSIDDLRAMSWQQFEQLAGECFRRSGYRVSETGQGGADGGIDLLLKRGTEKILVQCKQWKTTSVGAPVVREMFGLMTHHKADRVKIVCCGKFTREAIAFADGKPIDLIGANALLHLVAGVQRDKP